ncbi:MAG: phosphoglucosamine mutase [Peptococcaceae bacterium BRH_c4b]|nr:MAG: phosphoglucosamine mutase [Peptococcaceae bacterium BRH_c4b]
MGVLFGTDGVRGVANRELTPELALSIGRAGAYVLSRETGNTTLLIGRDTRISGDMLEAALTAGICSAGVNVLKAGILPTPAIAYLTSALGTSGGVVISASHNPVADNGIKFFGPSGYKLSDLMEEEIERLIDNPDKIPLPVGGGVGRSYQVEDALDRYVNFLVDAVPVDLSGLKVVVDCANGAAFAVAPRVLTKLGAEVIAINNTPDGVNINDNCGSTHPGELMKKVVEYGADLGLAHDGDADRVLAVDECGNLVDGDRIMVICARHLKEKGELARNTVVVTVMSNLGLHLALRESGINVLETSVGDRYVLEECLRCGSVFGGEQSGHILFLDHTPTGDGLLTALKLLAVVKESGKSLTELAAQMERLPQILKNVKVEDKQAVMSSPVLSEAIRQQERLLAGQGRILVRPSGTEPLVRVMVEGRNMDELEKIVDELTSLVKEIA